MSKSMNISAALIAATITAIGAIGLLILSLSATPNLLAWSSKTWFLPFTVSLTVFSVLMGLLARNRKRKPNHSKRTREKAARRLTQTALKSTKASRDRHSNYVS